MPERRWRVLGGGRGLFAIEVDDGGGFRAATTAEVDAALRQRELFGAADYPVQRVSPDDRDDVNMQKTNRLTKCATACGAGAASRAAAPCAVRIPACRAGPVPGRRSRPAWRGISRCATDPRARGVDPAAGRRAGAAACANTGYRHDSCGNTR